MAKGPFWFSTALNGVFSYPCFTPPSGLTLSALFCFPLRENVDMERAGRVGAAGALVCGPGFSGERERARVAEGVLRCEEDVLLVLLVLPLESLVRRESLRERCSWAPMSPMVEEMLWRATCLWRGGVVSTFGGKWNSCCESGGGLLAVGDVGGKLMVGGTADELRGSCVGVLGERCRPPKKEGLREKMLWLGVGAGGFAWLVMGVESWSIVSIVPMRAFPGAWIQGPTAASKQRRTGA
jgi:hypothetical protein